MQLRRLVIHSHDAALYVCLIVPLLQSEVYKKRTVRVLRHSPVSPRSTVTSFVNIRIVRSELCLYGCHRSHQKLPQNVLIIVNKHVLYSINITIQSITLQKSSFLFLTIRIFMIVLTNW